MISFMIGVSLFLSFSSLVLGFVIDSTQFVVLITRNGLNHSTSTANGTGVISFSNTVGDSPQRFEVFLQTQMSRDITPSQISRITRTTSNPLDTSPTYRWLDCCGDFSASHNYTVSSGGIDSSTYFVGACPSVFIEK
jgi:hypothetical protein